MNAEEMIDYVLGQVDGADRERLERALRDDAEQAARLERLRQAVDRLLDDGTPFEHPPDLAQRTVAFVARNRRRTRSLLDYVPIRVPFRWADFAVAASIFIAGVLTLLPAIQRSRERMNQAGCVFNLQQLGNSLAQYASLHPFLPYPPSHRSDTHAGMFAVMLHDAGVLNNLVAAGLSVQRRMPARHERAGELRPGRSDPPEPIRQRYQRMLCWDYAYNVGYRHASRARRPARVSPTRRRSPCSPTSPITTNFVTIREATAPTTAAAARTCSSATAASAGSAPATVGPQRPRPLSQQRPPAPAGRPRAATRSWCPARCRSTAGEAIG